MNREEIRARLERMRGAVKAGVVPVSAPDLFPTPDDVADRVVRYADIRGAMHVLEPSGGTGQLVRAVGRAAPLAPVVGYEWSPALADRAGWAVADFLEVEPRAFDRVVMNPPWSRGQDIEHVRHALKFLRPGGVLVAIVAAGPRQRDKLADLEWLEELPAGTFEGTQARGAVIRWHA